MAHDPLCPEDWFCICSYLYEADARARKQAAQRVEQAWQNFDDYQTIECQQCYTKEAFDLAAEAAGGE